MGQDTTPRLYENGQLIALPPGRRAHEMPNKIFEWHEFLQNLTSNFDIFFLDQLLEAVDFLPWLHLLLAVCRLGGNSAQSFASSFYHVILQKSWISPPSDLKLRFAQNLEDDKNNGITNDF
ncbi:3930_t:CDS:2, partial [Funneliformis caledonium]